MLILNHLALTKLRVSHLLSIAEVARAASLSKATVRKLEMGGPSRPETVRKVLAAFGLTFAKAVDAGLFVTG